MVFASHCNVRTIKVLRFVGDFWHGDPVTTRLTEVNYSSLATLWMTDCPVLEKNRNAGYALMEIWEREFDEKLRTHANFKRFLEEECDENKAGITTFVPCIYSLISVVSSASVIQKYFLTRINDHQQFLPVKMHGKLVFLLCRKCCEERWWCPHQYKKDVQIPWM